MFHTAVHGDIPPPSHMPHRRKWLRFGMRTMLVIVTLFAVWLASVVRSVRMQREAITAIQSAGGTIFYDYHESGPRSWSTSGIPRGPGWARNILGAEYFDRVKYIGLYNTPETSDWIDGFNRLKGVKTLLLSGHHVTDETLNNMIGSRSLLELHLTNASISNDGLRSLGKFPNLRWLIANHTSITDEGVAHLSALHGLREVNLNNTKVSNQSITTIARMNELVQLDVRGTLITKEGADQLRTLLPRVTLLK